MVESLVKEFFFRLLRMSKNDEGGMKREKSIPESDVLVALTVKKITRGFTSI